MDKDEKIKKLRKALRRLLDARVAGTEKEKFAAQRHAGKILEELEETKDDVDTDVRREEV